MWIYPPATGSSKELAVKIIKYVRNTEDIFVIFNIVRFSQQTRISSHIFDVDDNSKSVNVKHNYSVRSWRNSTSNFRASPRCTYFA